jgi:hypothetical protein
MAALRPCLTAQLALGRTFLRSIPSPDAPLGDGFAAARPRPPAIITRVLHISWFQKIFLLIFPHG